MAYGVKISKEGYDVKTTEDINLIITSEKECLKHFMSGIESISVPSQGIYTATINHNLDYYPMYIAMIKVPEVNYWYPLPSDESIGVLNGMWVTKTQMIVKLIADPNATFGTYQVKYFIFANKIES